MPTVTLPPQKRGESNVLISDARSVVVIGANGTGKTRLGVFVETNAGEKSHRIAAQRSLAVPILVQPRAFEQAESTLRYGVYQPTWNASQTHAQKGGHRWGGEPYVSMLNDYEHLLALLFADEAKRDRTYTRAVKAGGPRDLPVACKLETLAEIWARVMPQRELAIGDDRLSAKVAGGQPYEARHMSDGERVALYLMGQSLCAPADAVVVIDEPELHLHRAIQALLWDQIEAARPDCTFVYITHDLDFAASRAGARQIWIQEYDGAAWTWQECEGSGPLPDAVRMQVLGSRRPVMFVEGEDSSHDLALFSALYPEHLVLARGSCEKVVEATKAISEVPQLHHVAVRGVVDRDRRGVDEVTALKGHGLWVAGVAEVENLFCIPEALDAAALQLKADSSKVVVAKARVIEELQKQCAQQALARAVAEVQFRLNGFGPSSARADAAQLQSELTAYLATINIASAVSAAQTLFDDVVARNNYVGALRYFNCKGIPAFVAAAFGVKAEVLTKLVLALVREEPKGLLATAMRRTIEEA